MPRSIGSDQGPIIDGDVRYRGKVGSDLSVEDGYAAARLTGINLIAASWGRKNLKAGDEVVLSVTIEAKAGDIAVYLAEVKQAGVFLVRGFGADETRRILGSFAPNILFPYIRQTVSDVVVKGGFPPFLLPHVNFDALFERSLQEQAARKSGQAAPEQPN